MWKFFKHVCLQIFVLFKNLLVQIIKKFQYKKFRNLFNKLLSWRKNTVDTTNNILVIADTQASIGDTFLLIQTLINFDNNGEKIDVIISENFKEIIQRLDFSNNINFLFKKNYFGSHHNFKYKKESYRKNKKFIVNTFKEFIGKKYEFVFLMSQKITLENLIILNSIWFEKIYKIQEFYNDLNIINLTILQRSKIFSEICIKNIQNKIEEIFDKNFENLRLDEICFEIFYKILNKNPLKKFVFHNLEKISFENNLQEKFKLNESFLKNYNVLVINRKFSKTFKLHEIVKSLNWYNTLEKLNFIFVGDNKSGEAEIFNEVKKEINFNYVNLLGKTNLFEILEIIKKSQCVISSDSGIFHISNSFFKKTILIINYFEHTWNVLKNYWTKYDNNYILSLPEQNFYSSKKQNELCLPIDLLDRIEHTKKELIITLDNKKYYFNSSIDSFLKNRKNQTENLKSICVVFPSKIDSSCINFNFLVLFLNALKKDQPNIKIYFYFEGGSSLIAVKKVFIEKVKYLNFSFLEINNFDNERFIDLFILLSTKCDDYEELNENKKMFFLNLTNKNNKHAGLYLDNKFFYNNFFASFENFFFDYKNVVDSIIKILIIKKEDEWNNMMISNNSIYLKEK